LLLSVKIKHLFNFKEENANYLLFLVKKNYNIHNGRLCNMHSREKLKNVLVRKPGRKSYYLLLLILILGLLDDFETL